MAEDGGDRRDGERPSRPARDPRPSPLARPLLIALGWTMVGLGVIGIFLPLLPTVPFLLVAAWAFSRSSERFHRCLYEHPKLGPPVRHWDEHGVIPPRAKAIAVIGVWASVAIVAAFVARDWWLPAVHSAVALAVSVFILSRPSRPRG